MKILFRVDAGEGIGLGHFARSVSLANELKHRGHLIDFVCKESNFWKEKIDSGFPYPVSVLHKGNNEINFLKDKGYDLLYVDGNINYSLEESEGIKKYVPICMYQNLSDAKVFADVYILPSIHQNSNFFQDFENSTKVFQGLSYFTFNESLYSLKSIEVCSEITKIGVVTGGSDPRNILSGVYKLVENLESLDGIKFDFFLGESYLHKGSMPKSSVYRRFIPFDYRTITTCDLVICAFGVSTYEMMALGIPIISVGHQQSTSEAAQYLADQTESILHLGLYDQLSKASLQSAIDKMRKEQVRKFYSKKARGVVDLKGVSRVADIIESNFNAK